MSAAATAAGYLYASGRLRGRAAREQEEHREQQPQEQQQAQPRREKSAPQKEKIRVAVYPDPKEEKPRRTPKVEYRTRKRWTPE